MFLSLNSYIWPEKYQRVPQKLTQKIHDCAYDACLSHQNLYTARVPSQFPQSASSVTGCWVSLSASCWFSDRYHHNSTRRAELKKMTWYYCITFTSCPGLSTALQQWGPTVSDVFLSNSIDCTQCPRYIIKDHLLCLAYNQLFTTCNWLYTEEVVMETTFSYSVVCYASGHAWQWP